MKPQPPPVAVFKPSRWPGLIWAVPIAALGLVVWLAVNAWAQRGPSVTVSFPISDGLQAGTTKVKYRGFEVGEVREAHLAKGLDRLVVRLDFISSMAGHLGPGTRYWITGDTLDFNNLASMRALLSGPFIGIDPKPGRTMAIAQGLETPPDLSEPQPGAVAYAAVFEGGPAGLKPGSEVRLEDSPAGAVTKVDMQYDPAQHRLLTRVDFVLQPQDIVLAGEAWNWKDTRPQMDAMISALVERGLRAEISFSVPIVGEKIVRLALSQDKPPARLAAGNPPRIPVLGGQGDIQRILDQANDMLATLKSLPLTPIADNVLQTTSHLDDLTRQADAQIPDILKRLQEATAATEQAMQRVQTILSEESPSNRAADTADLPHALYELSNAARSLRELTDFLNQHPNALIFGREQH